MKDKRLQQIETRIKVLKGKKLTEEDYKMYCINCGKEITNWDCFFSWNATRTGILGYAHRWCPKEEERGNKKGWRKK